MDRTAYNILKEWKINTDRKPLIVRGARQVGKTTCVRHFGRTFSNFVELNFERMTELHALFAKDLDPIRLITDSQVLTKQEIVPGKTLLFFDEAQACPQVLVALKLLCYRYFLPYNKGMLLGVIFRGKFLG